MCILSERAVTTLSDEFTEGQRFATLHGLSGSLGKSVQTAVGAANDAIRDVLGGTTLAALVKK